MQKLKKIKVAHTLPKGKWREKYACRPNKGDHVFVLVKPDFVDRYPELKGMSVVAYYEHEEKERRKKEREWRRQARELGLYNGSVMGYSYPLGRWYECKHCGKSEYEPAGNINKKIKIRELPWENKRS